MKRQSAKDGHSIYRHDTTGRWSVIKGDTRLIPGWTCYGWTCGSWMDAQRMIADLEAEWKAKASA